ncbi:hypothetical protein HMPREF2087_00021 [Helicobacter canis NCTC 12740]|uniref:Uncharacterized protein n=1 Tax=Helicobacter canis NCTC 12740 TaxID=1357399 RepID=V8CI84_9HELI|nr:hypothetical protein HMPREF2087_00021 [Helicobacter canis NCTC 12740]
MLTSNIQGLVIESLVFITIIIGLLIYRATLKK